MCQENNQLIAIKIIPNSSKNQFVGILDGALKIKITAPPIEGKANAQLIKFLSKQSGVSKSKIIIESGSTSKHKMISIEGFNADSLERALSQGTK
ncbi:MAG: DUF167 family protein [Opitutales bacterium]